MRFMDLKLAKTLYARFSCIYGHLFSKDYHSERFVDTWATEWMEGLAGIDVGEIKKALDHCRSYLTFPPSLPEFRQICEREAGLPLLDEAFRLAIRKEFTHPVVFMAYNSIGSWDMHHQAEEKLKDRFKTAYSKATIDFRVNPTQEWSELKKFNDEATIKLEQASKIPSPEERMGFMQNLAAWKAKAKAEHGGKEKFEHPVFDQRAITRGHPKFDQNVFDERKKYLLGLDEYEAGTLPPGDWYDRVRFNREIDAMAHLKKVGNGYGGGSEKVEPRAYNSRKEPYKKWMFD